jgi:hypothetical protein
MRAAAWTAKLPACSLNAWGICMTTKKPTHLKVSRSKRAASLIAKKPGDLKVRRGKRKLMTVRQQVLRNERWYASAVMQIGIKAGAQSSDR